VKSDISAVDGSGKLKQSAHTIWSGHNIVNWSRGGGGALAQRCPGPLEILACALAFRSWRTKEGSSTHLLRQAIFGPNHSPTATFSLLAHVLAQHSARVSASQLCVGALVVPFATAHSLGGRLGRPAYIYMYICTIYVCCDALDAIEWALALRKCEARLVESDCCSGRLQ